MMALNPNPKAHYRNIPQAFYRIVTQENSRALFRGMGVVASGAGPAHAIYFACYEFSKKSLSGGNRSTVLSQGAVYNDNPNQLYCGGLVIQTMEYFSQLADIER